MNGAIQNQVSPPSQQAALDFSNVDVNKPIKAIDSTDREAAKVDFGNILSASNEETEKTRVAVAKGDLSQAKTETDLFKMMNDPSKKARTPKNSLDKDDFLKLFITQLQYQDPLNPNDASQMSAQLAQFNGLEQMMNMNKSMDKMVKAQDSNKSLLLGDYIGREVSMRNGKLRLFDKELTDASFKIDKPLSSVEAEVRNSAGELVGKVDMGSLKEGEYKVEWDAKTINGEDAPDGVYSFSLSAMGENNQKVPVEINSKVKITGIDLSDANGALYTEVGRMNLADIKAVGESGFMAGKTKKKPVEQLDKVEKEADSEESQGAKTAGKATEDAKENQKTKAKESTDEVTEENKIAASDKANDKKTVAKEDSASKPKEVKKDKEDVVEDTKNKVKNFDRGTLVNQMTAKKPDSESGEELKKKARIKPSENISFPESSDHVLAREISRPRIS